MLTMKTGDCLSESLGFYKAGMKEMLFLVIHP